MILDFLFVSLENVFFQVGALIVFFILIYSISFDFDTPLERGKSAHTINFLGSVALVSFLAYHFNFNLEAMKANWLLDVMLVVGYYLIGVLWSFVKWVLFLKSVKTKFDSVVEKITTANNISIRELFSPKSETDSGIDNLKVLVSNLGYEEILSRKRSFSDYANNPALIYQDIQPSASNDTAKGVILDWILAWPYSVAIFILKDFIGVLTRFFFTKFKGIYQHIQKAVFKPIM